MQVIATDIRVRIAVSGVVQGVGFRPFVYNLAVRHSLVGYVRNNAGSVEIEVQGSSCAIDSFIDKLRRKPPPVSLIQYISTEYIDIPSEPESQFEIRQSAASSSVQQNFVPADMATCRDCLNELFDETNRRFRYPFINCTSCGPRFTIISSLPYDRPSTTMAAFKMCRLCQKEYDDPADRRFHAQPNACANCGPSLTFFDRKKSQHYSNEAALAHTIEQLQAGHIIAIKGLGGFHLVCDAKDGAAVQRLRQRKLRARKPFALMMSSLDMVRKHCHLSVEEQREITSLHRPIVLLKRRHDTILSTDVAPGLDCLGVMLPYTPLHHLLLSDYGNPLVVTSGNTSEEPIAIDNDEAIERLVNIADSFLVHDRQIHSRYDDSVVQIIDKEKITLRRARGIAPLAIRLPFKATAQVLACGAHLKNTFCLIQNDQAYVSQHIGDLENVETSEHFEQTLKTYTNLFGFAPDIIAHDSHPDYLSTAFGNQLAAGGQLLQFDVQHHHAHIVSCMIEHGLMEPVIGVAFDGHGYGLDGTLWGGEFFIASPTRCERLAHLEPVRLPGGSQGIKQPWRMALSYAYSGPPGNTGAFPGFAEALSELHGKQAVQIVKKQIESGLNSPFTSSCGRLFDAMSALLGNHYTTGYEGQAAIELQALANQAIEHLDSASAPYPFEIIGDSAPFVVSAKPVLEAAYADYLQGTKASMVAARFHHTIAHMMLATCYRLHRLTGIEKICLSGGVFQNILLLRLAKKLLSSAGLQVFFPQQLPANDGGLSLGQAVVALAKADAITMPGF